MLLPYKERSRTTLYSYTCNVRFNVLIFIFLRNQIKLKLQILAPTPDRLNNTMSPKLHVTDIFHKNTIYYLIN